MSTATSGLTPACAAEEDIAGLLDQALKRADRLGLDLVAVHIAHAIDQLGRDRPVIGNTADRG